MSDKFFKQNPHPLIEDHYHIQELINSQEKRSADRTYYRDKDKEKAEREDLIAEAKQFIVTDFWCRKCKEDFKAVAIKEIEEDWSKPSQRVAFYKTKCFKGHWCKRLITDRFLDYFWQRSRSVARDRGVHHNDILQPFETGYNLLYGKK